MNELQIFRNPEFGEVRTIEIDGEPYFVGKDVADILKYQNGSRDINRHVDVEDKADVVIHDGSQNRQMVAINESGLYSLIFSSKLPKAKQFKRWVTSEVLPAIRKTGSYSTAQSIEDVLILSLQEMKEVKRQLIGTNERIDNMQDIIQLDTTSWREDGRRLVVKIAQHLGGNEFIRDVQSEIYRLLEKRGGVSLGIRLTNLRRRMAEEGVCKSKRDKQNYMDVIAADKKLIEIYNAILKEAAVKYGIAAVQTK